ncbi:MAG: hypothetical protein EOM25_05315 [Deltaproteobacteria bacterium]|nr:hypothetical protein [Deltaproteobacteria bacterium]
MLNESTLSLLSHFRRQAWSVCGALLPGMVHNANNMCHVIDMQIELLQSKIRNRPETPIQDQATKFERIASGSRQLMGLLAILGQRQTYVSEQDTQIESGEYLNWLTAFWQSDLTFKHKTAPENTVKPGTPNLVLPPLLLTCTLEAILLQALEGARNHEGGRLPFVFTATPWSHGAAFSLAVPASPGFTSRPTDTTDGLTLEAVPGLGWEPFTSHDGSTVTKGIRIPRQKTDLRGCA